MPATPAVIRLKRRQAPKDRLAVPRLLAVATVLLIGVGCSDDADSATPDGTSGGGVDVFAASRIDCVDAINAFRATEALPPLTRWSDGESCADTQGLADSNASASHANYGDCGEGAQNTCGARNSTDQIIDGCLQSMWDEGPGEPFSEHGHYLNMSSTDYTEVACAFVELADGSIWASQNFH